MAKWPRIRLRTLFMLILCAAVGLATGASPPQPLDPALVGIIEPPHLNWHYGLLSAASAAMVIGLIQQICQLVPLRRAHDTQRDDFAFAVWYGIVWRVMVALTITACLFLRMFLSRQVFALPQHRDFFFCEIIPDQLLLLSVIVVLSVSIIRWRRKSIRKPPAQWQKTAAWLTGILLAFLVLPRDRLVHFLVYIAVAGVEQAQPLALQRIGSYPDQRLEGFRLFWISLAAVGALGIAVALFISIGRDEKRRSRHLKTSAFTLLLFTVAAFSAWYYSRELPRLSPDFAEAGFPGNWLDWLGGAILACFAISVGAYLQARGEAAVKIIESPAKERDQISLHESLVCQLLLIAAALIYLEEMSRAYFRAGSFGLTKFAEIIEYAVQEPTITLCLAICILSVQLAWVCWRRRNVVFVWEFAELNRRRFVWNWFGFAALAIAGIPTISAYSFAFWLGPWYVYGK